MRVGWNQMFGLSCSRTLTFILFLVILVAHQWYGHTGVQQLEFVSSTHVFSCLPACVSIHTDVQQLLLFYFILVYHSGLFQGLVIFSLIYLWSYSCLNYWILLFLWLHLCGKLRTNQSPLESFVLSFLFQPWVALKYHGSKTDFSARYLQRMIAQEGSPIQFTMNPYGFYLVIDTYYLFFWVHCAYGLHNERQSSHSSKPVFFLSGI